MKSTIKYLASLVSFICLLSGCNSKFPEKISLPDAARDPTFKVTVQGIDVSQMSITVQSQNKTTVVIPAGTILTSNSSGTQNMMTASTVRFVFTGNSTPETMSQNVEVYCINRFLHAPTQESSYEVPAQDSTSPLVKLAACLDGNGAEHYVRQLAVWMVADDLMNMSKQDVLKKFTEKFIPIMKENLNNKKDSIINVYRKNAPADDNHTDDEVIELLYSILPQAAKQAAQEHLDEYEEAAPLLQNCGIDIATKRFFQKS